MRLILRLTVLCAGVLGTALFLVTCVEIDATDRITAELASASCNTSMFEGELAGPGVEFDEEDILERVVAASEQLGETASESSPSSDCWRSVQIILDRRPEIDDDSLLQLVDDALDFGNEEIARTIAQHDWERFCSIGVGQQGLDSLIEEC